MNQAIRKWIEENHQPWRSSPELSIHRGPIGSDRALPLNSAVFTYFQQQGVPIEGRLLEDLLESELLEVFVTISSWLTPEDRQALEENVAFGAALTREPNACAMPCLDGYAILFDYSFDTLMISATDLYHALLKSPQAVDANEFPLALNTAILSVFFRRAAYTTPIPDDFVHRELTNRDIWLISVFLLGHEVGHVMQSHFVDAPTRFGAFPSHPGATTVAILQPAHEMEFEADQYSIDLMFQGEGKGGLIRPDAGSKAFWNGAYSTLGWLFSTLGAMEALARRLDFDIGDTHPPALERWQRIAELIRNRASIDPSTIKVEEMMRENASRSAEFGNLPALHEETEAEYVALPYSALMADLMLDMRDGGQPEWVPPSLRGVR
ncbi:MAG: hypothetical protein QOH06_1095 [Acidobacteriota bacterium]|jgi:hypothetical protein|nr:hypothetical protein [Acidobacteriota bacterium]